ncbi:MAG: hypothetical protein HYU67_10625 [Flavobacteriia bacterium]|nr:hypothetical protein [Flavobacteriia bacterium]
MKKIYFTLGLFCSVFLSSAQNDYLKPSPFTFDLTFILNQSGQNSINGIVNSLNSTADVKNVTIISPTEISLKLQNVKQNLPSEISFPIINGLLQHCNTFYFSDNNQMLENFKPERVNSKNLIISALSTTSDFINLSEQLLQDKSILFVNSNLNTHELYLIFDNKYSDEDLKKILLNLNKIIITNQEEYNLYY